MGVNNRTFFINGESKSGAEMTTWIISKTLQGSGIGTKIISHIQSNYDVVSGFGISEAALRVYMRQDFRFIKQIPRFIKVVNFEPLKKYAKYDPLAQDLIDRWAVKKSSRFVVNELNELTVEVSNSYLKRHFNHFSRDFAHLSWRYQNHPYFQHRQFVISSSPQNDHAPVFVCLREELSVADLKILHVLDCFGADENIPAAVDFIENYAVEHNFDVIDFYCTAATINCHFLNSGWFSTSDDMCFQFPNLFHPIEMRDPPTANVVYWSKNNFEKLADLSNLYITKQDSDLDRPTPENMK
jgi:Txe/YoeB family toxin of Txe-Axe toxin-antitoxin module